MATIPRTAKSGPSLQHGQLGLFGVIMPGVAQVAPAFNLFFTTGLMVGLAGASAPLIFLISMVGMVATASSLVLEGNWDRDKLVLMSFPDEAAFHAWANSPEYLEIAKDRKAGAQAIVLMARGFAPN